MILGKVKKTIRQYNLIHKGERIVVGVSGGPDSLALLYILNSLKKESCLNLHIAHLDHMLRKDSDKDRDYVEKISASLELPVSAGRINVKALSKIGSVEEIARNARLGFLFKVARDFKTKKIALGHNLDDQAETVLMRMIRGTGLNGLTGILPKREIAKFQIIRPLIEIKRKEIEAYLKRKRIKPLRDTSNQEDIYLRNNIRNNLLPLLEKEYNKNIKEVLANMAQSIGLDYEYLRKAAERSAGGHSTCINLKKLSRLHQAIQRLIFRQAISKLKGNTRRISFTHIKEIEDLILSRPLNSIVDLPCGVSVAKRNKSLLFYRR